MNIASIVAEEKEKLLQKEKEHVSARDDFLSIASHELKTPLTSLKLQSQLMLRSIQKNDKEVFNPEKVTSIVTLIDTQTTRLTRLVDDMLDISRIRTGHLKMIKESLELTEVILDVTERLKPQFLHVIGETPNLELQENIRGEWDRFRLEQILTNLFTNAIRYGNKKPITVKTTVENRCAKIYVIDQGIGITKENKEKIFERFERAGMSLNEVSGLGLGLFITNQIIKAHGGSIRVESEPGKGSTFIVELPLSV
jgi:signal transduction histidine kinase